MMSQGTVKTLHVHIKGRVQGVWYRGWTKHNANALHIKGWVRNLRDGSVEAVFAGSSENLDRMLELCQEGPSAARVTDLDIRDKFTDVPEGFEIRDTL